MSNNSISRSFRILDNNVNEQSQVFDHLVPVADVATGEQFLLLCSHYCRWPADLLGQATLIEGCYTPSEYQNDSRLALGYHSSTVTSWDVDYKNRTVTLSTRISAEARADARTVRLNYLPVQLDCHFRRHELRYLRRFINLDIPNPEEGFATECLRLYANKPNALIYLPYFINRAWRDLGGDKYIEGSRSNLPEHGTGVEVSCMDDMTEINPSNYRAMQLKATGGNTSLNLQYEYRNGDGEGMELFVHRSIPDAGWYTASALPLVRQNWKEQTVDFMFCADDQAAALNSCGWYEAEPFPYIKEKGYLEVTRDAGEYMKAVELQYAFDDKEFAVVKDIPEYGFYKSVSEPFTRHRPDLLVVCRNMEEEGFLCAKNLPNIPPDEFGSYYDYDEYYNDDPYILDGDFDGDAAAEAYGATYEPDVDAGLW